MTDLRTSFDSLCPEYEDLWAKVNTVGGVPKMAQAQDQARSILVRKEIYYADVEKRTGVLWFVIAIIHVRESGSPPNFRAWLHNGDPMFDDHGRPRQTVHVPAGRPPNPRCTWEDGACDALHLDGLTNIKDWSPARVAFVLETFNGFGYRQFHHIPSPYLWGGTIVQKPGKYVRDKHFDPHVMDEQIGGMALLAALMQLDASVKFESEAVTA